MKLIDELRWRGLVSNSLSSNMLDNEKITFYVGTDPTGRSLHVGHLLAFVVAKLLQQHGHKPIILVGGATASLGDPSFKAEERKLMPREEIEANAANIKKQLAKIINFEEGDNKAELLNNYDWMKDYSFLDFTRDIGKLITVNYMMSKESVRLRLSREGSGLSFTEFTYQLLQGYDFLHLYQKYNCKMQIGGSDQWGNIMTGTELIRKSLGSEHQVGAIVWPLVTRADGTKFGKSEGGKNVWLDPTLTSPYEFYQFWLNQADNDAEKYIKMFTLLPIDEIDNIINENRKNPHLRLLQHKLAEEVTIMVHGKDALDNAITTTKVIFGNSSVEEIEKLSENDIVNAFKGIPTFSINKEMLNNKVTQILSSTKAISSKREARELLQKGGLSLNKQKIQTDIDLSERNLIHNKFLIFQKGKKNYFLFVVE